ncbi:MAG: aminoacyl-histidine dipeptidase [Holophaga sp.]
MEDLLESLEPRVLWKYFLELSKIPRGSGNEAPAAAWVLEQARALGCEAEQDPAGNVLIRKGAAPGCEGAPVVALQSHVDMVCEKNEGTVHDFKADPIQVVRDGDLLRARGTTLGADNGIGVAASLAVLESRTLRHGPLEVLVTVGEEVGLAGARRLGQGILRAVCMLNLDGGRPGYLTIGCSGGMDSRAFRAVRRRPAGPGTAGYRIKVSGLKGGHSGVDVNKGRANAIQLLARALRSLGPRFDLELASLDGGGKRNAIPREAFAVVAMDPARETGLREALAALQGEVREAVDSFDPGIAFELGRADGAAREVFDPGDARAVVGFLCALAPGIVAMSPAIPGLVQTSTNLATVATDAEEVQVGFSHRSSVASDKAAAADRVAALCELAGFRFQLGGSYPGWRPDPGSPLVKRIIALHETLFGSPAQLRATHGGLECGIIGQGHPGLQMVSFGPDMWDNHTPDERVSISSVAGFWKLLAGVLEDLTTP